MDRKREGLVGNLNNMLIWPFKIIGKNLDELHGWE